MTQPRALAATRPDPLGIRWAVARDRGRVYLVARWPDGTTLTEIRRDRHGEPLRRRISAPPRRLCWQPLTVTYEPQPRDSGG